jgi:ribosomal protein S18 acetylase RimI-like enzyme
LSATETNGSFDLASITLRPATADDEAFLFDLFASTREEFNFLEESQKQAILRMQYDARRFQYDEGYPQAEASIIFLEDRPAGRMLVDEAEHAITLIDIAMLPQFRGSGIGTRLLQDLLKRAVIARKPVKLQVFKTNPAQRLYERLGFSRTGEQSMYLEMIFEPSG